MNAAFRLLLLLISTTALGCNRTQTVAPFGSERIELSYDHDGQRYYVVDDGNMYRQTDQPEAWELVTHVFDPEEMKQAYLVKEGKTYRVAPDTGQQYEVQLDIAESFEDLTTGLPGLFELVANSGCAGATLLCSPLTIPWSRTMWLIVKLCGRGWRGLQMHVSSRHQSWPIRALDR